MELPMFREPLKKILFVCTGNSCRSVMAEAIFKRMLRHHRLRIAVSSAGLEAPIGITASPLTLQLLKNFGIDASHHRSRRLTIEMIDSADLIFVMEKNHLRQILSKVPAAKEKTFLLSDFHPEFKSEGVGIPDPMGMGEIFYENVIELIKTCCSEILSLIDVTSTENKFHHAPLGVPHQ